MVGFLPSLFSPACFFFYTKILVFFSVSGTVVFAIEVTLFHQFGEIELDKCFLHCIFHEFGHFLIFLGYVDSVILHCDGCHDGCIFS